MEIMAVHTVLALSESGLVRTTISLSNRFSHYSHLDLLMKLAMLKTHVTWVYHTNHTLYRSDHKSGRSISLVGQLLNSLFRSDPMIIENRSDAHKLGLCRQRAELFERRGGLERGGNLTLAELRPRKAMAK